MKKPLITAHTGCMNTPPNSLQSVLEGLQAGADIIEVDVRATKDGIVVLLHDEELITPDGIRQVQELSFEEMKRLAQYDGVVRLEEVLPLIKEQHRVINLDVKEDSAIDPMIKTVEAYHMRDYAIITGCEAERAAYLKEHHRPYQVLLNASIRLYETYKGDYASFMQETCRDAISASCCGININYHLCQQELLDYARLRCLPVLVWTVDDAHEMERFLDMDVQSITSNRIDKLIRLRDLRK